MTNEKQDDKPDTSPAGKTAATGREKPRDSKARDHAAGKSDKANTSRTGRTLLWLFVLLVVLAAIAAAGWFGWQWLETQRADYQAVLDAQSTQISRLEERLDRVSETHAGRDELETLQASVADTKMMLQDRLARVAGDMEALRDAAQGGRRDLAQAEIEYLLRIAADELYLTQDVDTAIYALQAADDRLRELGDPRLTPVRQLIADHLRELGALNLPDRTGMALKLGSMAREVSALPLRQAEHARAMETDGAPADAEGGWWGRLRGGFTRLFDKLLVVQRAEPPAPLLTPEEHFFLYRNVELHLTAARAALLSGDAAAYRQSLQIAREWLDRYFNGNDPAVQNAIADITGLLEVSLQPALPDITPALDRFRTLARQTGARAE